MFSLILEDCRRNGQIPTTQGFLNLKNLEYLDLSSNTFDNNILQSIGTMTSLKTLILMSCKLDGQIPRAQGLCDLNHLQKLYMYDNDLNGFLPPCLANLTSLQQLDLSSNNLKIPMSLSPLYNLSKLKSFDGSGNEIFAEEDDHNLSPKFQLESLSLRGRGQDAGALPKFFYHQSIFVAKEFSCEFVIPKYIHESLPRPNTFRNRSSFARVSSFTYV
ncbi:hypothetical protein NC651_004588 [Populus alba x Populus x berolinensis]|nr:hypothetical protein NC651_004588 [Populus alba x Populus x berolinensis]